MPANLTRQYIKARERYQAASDPQEQLDALLEMLREIPKHKGTDHLQADLKRKIKEARHEVQVDKKHKKHGPSYRVDKGGRPQVVVLGPPNAGKSAIVQALTGVELGVAPYPYATREPHPAMMEFENARIQLVDMPPCSAEHIDTFVPSIVRAGDAVLLVVDLEAADLLEAHEAIVRHLASQRIYLGALPDAERDAVGAVAMRTLIAANKCDVPGADEALEIFRELAPSAAEVLAVSAATGAGIEALRARLWQLLDVVRAVPKPPGKAADVDEPILLPRGSTVLDLARAIHGELADHLKRARVWHSPDHAEGQWVARDHVVHDQEVFELGA